MAEISNWIKGGLLSVAIVLCFSFFYTSATVAPSAGGSAPYNVSAQVNLTFIQQSTKLQTSTANMMELIKSLQKPNGILDELWIFAQSVVSFMAIVIIDIPLTIFAIGYDLFNVLVPILPASSSSPVFLILSLVLYVPLIMLVLELISVLRAPSGKGY